MDSLRFSAIELWKECVKISLVILLLSFLVPSAGVTKQPFYTMQEHATNYFIVGEPDTKVQFSFKFQTLKHYPLFLAYTQTMFWDLGTKESSPFSEINYNPELFYQFDFEQSEIFRKLELGYSHISNGRDSLESRSIDALFVQLNGERTFSFGIPRVHLRIRALIGRDDTNQDVVDFLGPINFKFFFDKLGKKLFKSEEFYFEYYNGGSFSEDFSRSSFRFSFRFQVWTDLSAPKLFFQYFNGFGENLANFNVREETYRLGFSIGGF